MVSPLLTYAYRIGLGLTTGVITFYNLAPQDVVRNQVGKLFTALSILHVPSNFQDTLLHILGFAVLSFFFLYPPYKIHDRTKFTRSRIGILIGMAILLEALQGLQPARGLSLADILANGAGIALTVMIAMVGHKLARSRASS